MRDDEDRWPYAIGMLHLLKQQIGTLSPTALIGISPPQQAPDPTWAVEQLSGLPEDVVEWFVHADGWPEVWFDMNLLGLSEVVRIDTEADLQSRCRTSIPEQSPGNLLLLGRSDSNDHLVLVTLAEHGQDASGTTYWIEPDSLDRYPTFFDFFCAVIELHRDELSDLQAG